MSIIVEVDECNLIKVNSLDGIHIWRMTIWVMQEQFKCTFFLKY